MYGGNKFGLSNYEQYKNYWRSTEADGLSKNRSATKKFGIVARYQWKILAITSTVIGAISFASAIYNSVVCSRDISSRTEASGSLAEVTASSREVSTSSREVSTSSTGFTTDDTAMTASSTRSVITDGITTEDITSSTVKPEPCVSGFIHYDDGEDRLEHNIIGQSLESRLSDESVKEVYVKYYSGYMEVRDRRISLYISVYVLHVDMITHNESAMYFHEATSQQELDVIRCLVADDSVEKAYVFTWVNLYAVDTGMPTGTFQSVVALGAQSAVYIIRTYADDLQPSEKTYMFYVYFGGIFYGKDILVKDVLNKRLVTQVVNSTVTTKTSSRQNAVCGC